MTRLEFDGRSFPLALAPYGRAVWARARDEALVWRRGGSGLAVTRDEGVPDADWWASVDGVFEATGGVLDLLFRTHTLAAAMDDSSGAIEASGDEGNVWLDLLEELCRDRGRDLRVKRRPAVAPRRRRRPSRLRPLIRRQVGVPRGVSRRDVLVILGLGAMARLGRDGRVVDRVHGDLVEALSGRFETQVMSLEPPRGLHLADARSLLSGHDLPWLSFVPLPDLWRYRTARARWIAALDLSGTFSIQASGVELERFLKARCIALVSRSLALAALHRIAFRNAIERIEPRLVLSSEAHSDVGRSLGAVAPGLPVLAPQGGIIAPDASTNAAYDHRSLPPLTPDGLRGCPVPTRSLVWGSYHRDVLLALDHRPDQIAVTGLPRPVGPTASGQPVGYLYIAGANTDVLSFTTSLHEELATIRAVRASISERIPLTVRLHPAHDTKTYSEHLPSDVRLSLPAHRSLGQDLAGASAVIGKSSTALVEAAAAGLPVLVVNLGPTPDLTGLAAAGLPYVDSADGLLPGLERIAAHAGGAPDLVASVGSRAVDAILDQVQSVVVT